MTGADDFGRDTAGRPSFDGDYPAAPAYDDMPTTEFSRLVFDDDGELPGGLGASQDRRGPMGNPLAGGSGPGSVRLPIIPGLSASPLGGSLGAANPRGGGHGADPRSGGAPGSPNQFGNGQAPDPRMGGAPGSPNPFGNEPGPGDPSADPFGAGSDRSQPSAPQGFPPAGGPPPPIRPRIPGIDGPAVPPGVFRDPPPFQAQGEPAYQRPVMPPVQPPPGRNPLSPPSPSQPRPPQGFGVPPQRDTNADSGPPPQRPERGARERQVLREAQQFDVFRRDPVVPPQAPPIPDDLIADAGDHPDDSAAQSGWNQGPIDISVYDQATAQQPPTGPGRDLGFPPLRPVDPSGSAVFAEYEDSQYDDGLGFDVPETGDPRVDASQRFDAPQLDQQHFDQQQFDQRFEPQPPHPLDTSQQFEPNQQFGTPQDFEPNQRFEPDPQPDAPQQFDGPQVADMRRFEQRQPQPQFVTPPAAFAGAHFDPPQFPEAEAAPVDDLVDEDQEPVFVAPLTPPAAPEAQPVPVFVVADADEATGALADPEPEMLVPWDTPAAEVPRVPPYDDAELAAVHRVIRERRDVRSTFLSDPIPDEVLTRVLEAAHTAPSVGFSQPWDFLVLRSEETRQAIHEIAVRQRDAYAASLPKARARAFKELKIEAILDTPVNIVVTCDPTRGGRHTLGRYTQPQMAPYSSALAVENLWLAARAEGLGVGWVSFFDERELTRTLDLPEHLTVVAYLCVGYVREFPDEPELSGSGWAKRRPLAWAVHDEHYGRRALPGSAPVSLLDETLAAIAPLDEEALSEARSRQARMTKPPGSLGVLEDVSVQLAGLAGVCPPPLPEPAAVAIFAADHGVHAQGVTPWPQEVTAQMVANFLAGGAVVNAFAAQIGAEVCVVDVGVNAELPAVTGLVPRKIRYGTADLSEGPAMTREEAVAALEVGIETARDLVASGNRCLLTGDMGIANTTASAALIAAFTGASPTQVTGYGTGIDEQTYAHKVEVVRRALDLHRPDPADPLGVLAAVGGLEHAALAGFILGAASLRTPVVLDGVIAGAAALVAQALSPEATSACVAGHRSAESGHQLALEALGIVPLIDLELRLGEGSGAVLALPLVQASVRALRDVATFESAGVAERPEDADQAPTE